MREKMTWKYYSSRRGGLSLAYLIDSKGLHNLEALTKYLDTLWVKPPSDEEFQHALTKTKNHSNFTKAPRSKPSEKKANSTSKTAGRKSTKKPPANKTAKKKAEENPTDVWEDAQEGAYQTESGATKKKAPAKKTSTRKTTTKKGT